MGNLPILYDNASLDVFNPSAAFQWALKAAQLGETKSKKKLAMIYLYADGPAFQCPMPDFKEALYWFKEFNKDKKEEVVEKYINILERFEHDLKIVESREVYLDTLICDYGNNKLTKEGIDMLEKVLEGDKVDPGKKAVYEYLKLTSLMIASAFIKEDQKRGFRNYKNHCINKIIDYYQ